MVLVVKLKLAADDPQSRVRIKAPRRLPGLRGRPAADFHILREHLTGFPPQLGVKLPPILLQTAPCSGLPPAIAYIRPSRHSCRSSDSRSKARCSSTECRVRALGKLIYLSPPPATIT